MPDREPVAFFSYVRSDDDHDAGRITDLRKRLEGEVKIQTGRPFHIFQDRNDIQWGEQWKERIETTLRGITFLIPIVTPSYFRSPSCRSEFDTFLIREKELGEERLILPIYYVLCDEMHDEKIVDAMAVTLRSRNWADWRPFRFKEITSPELREQVALLAGTIKDTSKHLESIFLAAAEAGDTLTPPSAPVVIEQLSAQPLDWHGFEVPAVRTNPAVKLNQETYERVIQNPYYAYTTIYDEVILATQLTKPAETIELHTKVLAYVRSKLGKDLEDQISEGLARIDRIAGKTRIAAMFLVDNSGSMRGRKILGVASWLSIISTLLTQRGILTEVVGYTTRAWKGGMSRELWIKDGKPPNPGRLNDVRYIAYKTFDQSQQEADTNFGVMLREGVLKENIDGEALLWGYSRLIDQRADRNLMFVLSDGAPVDDSTLSVNPANFLEMHCIGAIRLINSKRNVELYGIGIEHSVSRYYGPSPTLNAAEMGADLMSVVAGAIEKNWSDAVKIQRATPGEEPPRPAPPGPRRKRATSAF
jgi:nitroreductase